MGWIRCWWVFALVLGTAYGASSGKEPREMSLPESLSERLKSFEPSAVVQLPDLGAYLVASDDTDEEDSPLLFLMDDEGHVEADPLVIEGIDALTDIESLSLDSSYLYILSSQSLNKNGKDLPERNWIVRARRSGRRIEAESAFQLRPMLLRALEGSEDPDLRSMRKRFRKELDIEGHAVREGRLLVALKNPQPEPGVGLVLELGLVEDIFREETIRAADIRVARRLKLGEDDHISDFLIDGEDLLISTTEEEGAGKLWRFSAGQTRGTRLAEFPGFNLEGIASAGARGEYMGVFDQGDESGRYAKLRNR